MSETGNIGDVKKSVHAAKDVTDYAQALNQAVADELVGYRTAARMSQTELIAKTGLSKSTIIRIEAGRVDIGTRDIALITDVLGVEPSELMQRAQVRAAKKD